MNSEDDPYLELLKRHPHLCYPHQDGGLELRTDLPSRLKAEKDTREKLKLQNQQIHWSKTGIIAEDSYLLWLRDAVIFPDNKLGTYIRLIEKPLGLSGVAVLPIFKNKVVLVRHFRHATGQWHWEIPRGYAEENESVLEAAKRELEEEIGATVSDIEILGKYLPNTGLVGSAITILKAEVLSLGVTESGEGIRNMIQVSADEFKGMIKEGNIEDGFTLSAFAFWNTM